MKKQNQNLIVTAVALSMSLSLVGCEFATEEKTTEKVIITAQAQMDAETLALAGEQLVTPTSFMLADEVFTNALDKAPNNYRAQFYKSFIARAMVFKGILNRVKPLARANNDLANLEKTIKDIPESPIKDFLLDGSEDIRTVGDFQNFLDDYIAAVDGFRKFTKENIAKSITLNVNPYLFEETLNEHIVGACQVVERNAEVLEVECENTNLLTREVNTADMLALSQMAAGEVMFLTIYNAFSLNGLLELSNSDTYQSATPQVQLEMAKGVPGLGDLRNKKTFKILPQLGSDFASAVGWAIKYQDQLCPRGHEQYGQRAGKLFSDGICFEDRTKAKADLAILKSLLKGATSIEVESGNSEKKHVTVDAFAWAKKAPSSIFKILPSEVNDCGEAVSYFDPTFGGIFPEGNVVGTHDYECDPTDYENESTNSESSPVYEEEVYAASLEDM